MINSPHEYNMLVANDPALGPGYCVRDIDLLLVHRESKSSMGDVTRMVDREYRAQAREERFLSSSWAVRGQREARSAFGRT
jgi:hypothetical protein